MSQMFDSYIMVDWSAASKPTTGADSIWIGALTPDARFKLQYASSNPDTRDKAFKQLIAAIERLVKRGDRVLLGFDFPMGFPAGTSEALNLKTSEKPPHQLMSDFLLKEMKDKPDNTNNRFALASRMNWIMSEGPFPFWGCPKRDAISTLTVKKSRNHEDGDLAEFRQSELRAKQMKKGQPQPIWKLAYAGAVGGQALTGIPIVQKLRQYFEDKSAIWPLETNWLEEQDLPQIVISEVYPSLVKTAANPGQVKDESQVESLCRWFADLDSKGNLPVLFQRPDDLTDEESTKIQQEEGWILGI